MHVKTICRKAVKKVSKVWRNKENYKQRNLEDSEALHEWQRQKKLSCKDKTQEQESEEMQTQDSMTLLSSDETRITERQFFLIELRLSLLLQHTIKTLKYAETSSYTNTKAPMTVNTKEPQKKNFKRSLGADSNSIH